ncbi:hypothetical protein BDL97_08G139000 [Sphagnum fallax]|nr:hypothetical protein BDL97_08G139000 [Sphagnum fallax]
MVGVRSRRQCIGVEVAEFGCHFFYDRIKGLIISYYCITLQCNLVGLLTAKDQGVAVELLWTLVGGKVQFVEATAMLGKGHIHLTGQLGDVIKESSQIDLTWVYHANCLSDPWPQIVQRQKEKCQNEDARGRSNLYR